MFYSVGYVSEEEGREWRIRILEFRKKVASRLPSISDLGERAFCESVIRKAETYYAEMKKLQGVVGPG